jgi:dienelactone hydrolase
MDGATDGHPAASGHDGAGAAPRPLIIFLPIGGLATDIAGSYSRYFAGQGYAVLHLKRPPSRLDGQTVQVAQGDGEEPRQDTVNLRRTSPWARKLPGIDPERIQRILGVNRGATVTALATQQDPRISTVLVIGGADLDGLLRDSHMDAVRKLWKSETARLGGDVEKVMEEASAVFRDVDPATRRGRIDPARTLLINARWDRVVPRAEALALREVAGGATQAWLPCGHYTTLLFTRKIRSLAAEHFARTLRP